MDASPVAPDGEARVAALFGRAFEADPFVTWMYPDGASRVHRFERLMSRLLRVTRADGRVLATSGAGALWVPPGVPPLRRREQLRMIPELPRMRRRLPRVLAVLDLMDRRHPPEPHWYLFVVGSDPDVRGAGHGRAVIEPVLADCDRDGLPAYLESSNPDNVGYYERFGFRVTGELSRAGSPTLIPMWRDPVAR